MQIPRGTHCPLLDKKCIQQDCMFWTHLVGHHPQTGTAMDEWDCAIVWQPILLVENAQKMREAGAAVESFRNEVVKLSMSARAERAAEPKVIDGNDTTRKLE